MASRGSNKSKSRAVPDAVRRAVERTVQSTRGSAEGTRERAQELVDDVMRLAEQSAASAGRGVRGAGQRPAGAAAGVGDRVRDALQELRAATERLAERVAQLEAQLEAQLGVAPKRGSRSGERVEPSGRLGSTAKRPTARGRSARPQRSADRAKRSTAEARDRSEAKRATASKRRHAREAHRLREALDRAKPKRGDAAKRSTAASRDVRQARLRRHPLRLMGRRVLITGVAGFWGTELARCLERSPEVEYIAGLDVRPPAADLARTEFIRADIRNPLISKLLPQTGVDTVVHCDVLLVPEPGKAPEQLHDINVIGSLQLLAACEKTDTRPHDRRARLGRDLRRRAERARVLHRGHGTAVPVPDPVPA